MSQILLPHAPALPLAGFPAGPFGESSHLTALGGWRQSTLEKEENNAEWMHRKQAKPALLCLSPTGDEGRRVAGYADSSQELPENAWTRAGPGEQDPHAPGQGHSTGPDPLPTYPAPTARASPRSDLRRERAATASARSRGSPRSPLGPGARAPPAQTPAGGTKARPPPRSRTWQQVGEPPHGAFQLGRGGRVPPHVLLVALAQQAQAPHRAGSAGTGRGRRRRRHGAAAALLPGPPLPRPAPSSRAGPSAERAMGGGAGV